MEFTKTEVNVLQECVNEISEKEIRDLNDLQLAMVGGGIGEVIVG
jgi:hypothetical protein